MTNQPFWERSYQDDNVSTFGVHPNVEVEDLWNDFNKDWSILEVGCGEGKNALYLAQKGFDVHAFDISQPGILKLQKIAARNNIQLNAWVQDLTEYDFLESFDVIISYGTLHFVKKDAWTLFLEKAQISTRKDGLHIIQIFTDKVPASPDIAPFAVGLAEEGELFEFYKGWDIIQSRSYIFEDEHPGVPKHLHASNKIIARKV